MARISLIDEGNAPPDVRAVYAAARERGFARFMNQLKVLAHRPPILRRLWDLYMGFAAESVVDRRLIELAVLAVSRASACQYCIVHHTPLALQFGLTREQLAALEAGNWCESPAFSESERLVIAYAEQVERDPRQVSAELFRRLREVFSEAQVVELTVRIALCSFFNRFNQVLDLELEPGVLDEYLAVHPAPAEQSAERPGPTTQEGD